MFFLSWIILKDILNVKHMTYFLLHVDTQNIFSFPFFLTCAAFLVFYFASFARDKDTRNISLPS